MQVHYNAVNPKHYYSNGSITASMLGIILVLLGIVGVGATIYVEIRIGLQKTEDCLRLRVLDGEFKAQEDDVKKLQHDMMDCFKGAVKKNKLDIVILVVLIILYIVMEFKDFV